MRRLLALFLIVLALGAVLLVPRPSAAPARAPGADRPSLPEPPLSQDLPEIGTATVLDDAGQLVPGATLRLYALEGEWEPPRWRRLATVIADAQGRLPSALPSAHKVVIEAEGYPIQAHDFDASEIRVERGMDRTCVILDESGRPAVGARIEVFADCWHDVPLSSAEADRGGVVTLRAAGTAWLLASCPGCASQRLPGWHRVPDSLTLPTEFTIGGRIVDSAGRPLPGASVRFRQGDSICRMGPSEYDATLRAGEDGQFLFRAAHDDEGWLTAQLEGYDATSRSVHPGDTRVHVVMRRLASVSGVVVLPDGRPAAEAEVGTRHGETVKTDRNGGFHVAGLAPTPCDLFARLGYEWEGSARVEPKEGAAVTDIRIVLMELPRSYVRVRVIREDGSPVTGIRVAGDSDRGRVLLGNTDATGAVTLQCRGPAGIGARVGVFNLHDRLHLPNEVTARAVTQASADEGPVVELVLCEPVLVRLDARTEDGTPLLNARALSPGGIPGHEQWLDPVAEHTFTIWAPGYLSREVDGWRARDHGNTLVVTLERAGAIRGRVTVDGQMPEEIRVTWDGAACDVRCEPDGRFLIEYVREGRHTLDFTRRARLPEARVEVEAEAGGVTDIGTVTLVPSVTLSGRVLGHNGDPVGGARIEAHEGLKAHSRADGTFRVDASTFCRHLIVRRKGLATIRAEVQPGPSRSVGDLAMPSPGAVEVTLVGIDASESQKPYLGIAWAYAMATYADVHEFRPAERAYRCGDLAPGRYVAKLWVGDEVMEQEFTVAVGQTTSVTFRGP